MNYNAARVNKDERHICPLQLDTVARCIASYYNQSIINIQEELNND